MEYALVLALIALVAIAAVSLVGRRATGALCQVSGGLGARNGQCAITFSMTVGANSHVFTANLDGSGPTDLTPGSLYNNNSSVFSPDGGRIAFSSFGTGTGFSSIYVMLTDGTGLTRLTSDAADSDEDPDFSPDGRRIVFTRITTATSSDQIYTVNADGSGTATTITNTSSSDDRPVWSPDGSRIAFDSNRAGAIEVFSMDATGGNVRQLTPTVAGLSNYRPDYRSDGQITFGQQSAGNRQIFTMTGDGTNPFNLSNNAFNEFPPAWSADGQSILFVSNRGGAGGGYDIYRMNPDGSGVVRLTTFHNSGGIQADA